MSHTIWACPVTHQQSDGDWPFCSCCDPRQANVSIPVVLRVVADELAAALEHIPIRPGGSRLDNETRRTKALAKYREAVGE